MKMEWVCGRACQWTLGSESVRWLACTCRYWVMLEDIMVSFQYQVQLIDIFVSIIPPRIKVFYVHFWDSSESVFNLWEGRSCSRCMKMSFSRGLILFQSDISGINYLLTVYPFSNGQFDALGISVDMDSMVSYRYSCGTRMILKDSRSQCSSANRSPAKPAVHTPMFISQTFTSQLFTSRSFSNPDMEMVGFRVILSQRPQQLQQQQQQQQQTD